jgi:hypothetical protein
MGGLLLWGGLLIWEGFTMISSDFSLVFKLSNDNETIQDKSFFWTMKIFYNYTITVALIFIIGTL